MREDVYPEHDEDCDKLALSLPLLGRTTAKREGERSNVDEEYG